MRKQKVLGVSRFHVTMLGATAGYLMFASASSGQAPWTGEFAVCPEALYAERVRDAVLPTESAEAPCGTWGDSRYIFRATADGTVIPILVEGPWGPRVRTTLSHRQLKELLSADESVPSELGMTREALGQLVEQLDGVQAATEKYRDVNAALRDGYVAGKWGHFHHKGHREDGVFNPVEPEGLMYMQHEDGQLRLAGPYYLLPREDVGDTHPKGFAGPLDNWHVHYNTCYLQSAPEHENHVLWLDAKACERAGGRLFHGHGWMLHLWIHEENPRGVFSAQMEHDPDGQIADVLSAHDH